MRSRAWIAGLVLLALGAGCRDMLVPPNPDSDLGNLTLEVIGLGQDGPLHQALVTIDNSAWVAPDRAGSWEATSHLGLVTFEDRLAGTYDVSVIPAGAQYSTPRWTATGVVLGDSTVVVAYPGLPFEAEVDWPEFAALGVEVSDIKVEVRYRQELALNGSQPARDDGTGTLAGELPWAGNFRVSVVIGAPGFSLTYTPPDSMPIEGGDRVVIPSPLIRRPVTFTAGGGPLKSGSVRVEHRLLNRTSLLDYSLFYTLDLAVESDSLYLVTPWYSNLELSRIAGPEFLPRNRRLLAADMSPGAIDLGRQRIEFRVEDGSGASIGSAWLRVFAERQERYSLTDDAGQVEWFLDPGSYRVEASASGFLEDVRIVEIVSDQTVTIVLDEEAAP